MRGAIRFRRDDEGSAPHRLGSAYVVLRRALERDELRLDYQPIVDLATGVLRGVEALVRWHHPERGVIGPAGFIAAAEANGLIVPIGRWVLERAARDGARWAGRAGDGAVPIVVTVNVSPRQLQHPGFVGDVERAVAASGLAPERLVLEVTESAVVLCPDATRRRLGALRHHGIRVALDDFGIGYSALRYLQQFPFDLLKIDKSFVDPIAAGGADRHAALASAIVSLGAALSLETVAEGIETAAQRDALTAMGCAFGQGYLFSEPVSADAIAALLAGGG